MTKLDIVGRAEPHSKCQENQPGKTKLLENLGSFGRRSLLELEEVGECLKSCPTDCVLTEWSPWTSCQSLKGPKCVGSHTLGHRHRHRKVVQV